MTKQDLPKNTQSGLDTRAKKIMQDTEGKGNMPYISVIPIEKLWIKASKSVWKFIWIRIKHSLTQWERNNFTIFFERLDRAKQKKENFENKTENEQNYIKFSIEPNGEIEIWGIHMEWGTGRKEDVSLRWIKNEEGVKPSDFILDFTMEYLRQKGYQNFKTGSVRKPFFAKMLQKHWFIPYQEDIWVTVLTQEEIEKEVENLQIEISELENQIRKLRDNIPENYHIPTPIHPSTPNGKSKLKLSPEFTRKFEIEREISELTDTLDEKNRKLYNLENSYQKWIPIVYWYGSRREDNWTFRQPNYRWSSDDIWFYNVSQENKFPKDRDNITYIQTRYQYDWGGNKIEKTRANVLFTLSQILG